MQRIISLLKEKNHYLEKFKTVNDEEILNFSRGNFENVEIFYYSRDQILDLISCIDELLDEEMVARAETEASSEERNEIQYLFSERDNLVKAILTQDLQVISWIDQEKTSIIKELHDIRRGKKMVTAYHSGNRKQILDEEA